MNGFREKLRTDERMDEQSDKGGWIYRTNLRSRWVQKIEQPSIFELYGWTRIFESMALPTKYKTSEKIIAVVVVFEKPTDRLN